MTNENDLMRRGDALAFCKSFADDCRKEGVPLAMIGALSCHDAIAALPAVDLSDPVAVHANMLRGTIAKPTVEQIIHIYGVDAIRAAIDVQPDPTCCLGLSPTDCADVPSRQCNGMQPDPRDEVIARLVEALEGWVNIACHCNITDGSCCCGDDMENHAEPINCGHVSVDHGSYVADGMLKTTRAALAAAKAVQHG